ncbi:MAG: hypothetical protein M3680_36175 [Myxococcota bacterium]|nr:hypothetical protein [Myxococcota bacterium]
MRWLPLILLAACGAKPVPKPPTCDRPIAGLDAHLVPGRIVWFGEMHGTEESPRFVGDVACHAARGGRVQVGLEIPADEQPRLDRYLRSAGSAADREALVAGTFWSQADGRSSVAMVALIERVRTLRGAGAAIELVAYDVLTPGRDAAMAEAVVQARDAGAIVVALSGNVHSRRIKGVPWDAELVPTVAHLVARGLPVTTFLDAPAGGTMWACIATADHEPTCGVHPNGDRAGSATPWTLGPAPDSTHDGVYHVGPTTASPPARPAAPIATP